MGVAGGVWGAVGENDPHFVIKICQIATFYTDMFINFDKNKHRIKHESEFHTVNCQVYFDHCLMDLNRLYPKILDRPM